MQMKIASNEVIHFVGIGGIGMSGLAQIMHNMDFMIQGSYLSKSKFFCLYMRLKEKNALRGFSSYKFYA